MTMTLTLTGQGTKRTRQDRHCTRPSEAGWLVKGWSQIRHLPLSRAGRGSGARITVVSTSPSTEDPVFSFRVSRGSWQRGQLALLGFRDVLWTVKFTAQRAQRM